MGLIIAGLVAAGGFLFFFHALTGVATFTCVRVSSNMNLVSPEVDLLIILACLCAAWILGFLQKGAFSFRFVGLRFYGREEIDQGYITTKWLTAGFPILPIRSYVVAYRIKETFGYEFQYEENAMQPVEGYFHWPQMLRTALISYGTIAWCLGCLWLIFVAGC